MKVMNIHVKTLVGAVALSVALAPQAGYAQGLGGSSRLTGRYQPGPDSRQLLISTFRAADPKLREEGTEHFRTEIRSRVSSKEVYLIDRQVVESLLERSNYPKDTVLSPSDAKLMVGLGVRVDDYIDARVEEDGRGYRYSGMLYLTRDIALREKLPVKESGEQLRIAARELINAYNEVRKQFEHERRCTNLMRDGNFRGAADAAREGIKAYPEAVISRACLASALYQAKAPPAEVLAVAREILQRDSTNKYGLQYATESYLALGDTANYVSHALKLVAIDITNTQAIESIVTNLAAMRRTNEAVEIIDKAIEASPLEPSLHVLGLRLLISGERWKEVVERSATLARLDTAAVDTAFFIRLATAYQADSQPDSVAVTYRRAVEKFPDNAQFRLQYGQALRTLGRTEEALQAFKEALRVNPEFPQVRLFIADGYRLLEQPDSALAWLREANRTGENPETVSGMVMSLGGRYMASARQMAQDSNHVSARGEYEKAISYFAFADSVKASDQAKWFWAVAAWGIAGPLVQGLQSAPTCENARTAQQYSQVTFDQINGGGGRAGGETAGQIFGQLQSIIPYLEQVVGQVCK